MDQIKHLADLIHVVSKYALIQQIKSTRSSDGLSLKTQMIYTVVFLVRYVFSFSFFTLSLYKQSMKAALICLSLYTLYLITLEYYPSKQAKAADSFKSRYLYFIAFVIALICLSFDDFFFYNFSLWLESFALIPQIWILMQQNSIDNPMHKYMLVLGSYRVIYLVVWNCAMFQGDYVNNITLLAGLLQTSVYSSYVYQFYKKTAATPVKSTVV